MYRIGQEEIDAVAKVIETQSMFKINDKLQESKKVEEAIKDMFKTEYPIFMTSGHAALTSALIALGIGPGDEVIVPAYTYIATAMAVVAAGAIPVIAEIDETLTISPEDIEAKITKNTKAIMPVHIQGFPCKMDEIMAVAKKHNLYVVEDACQADGGSYKGKRLGTIGDAGGLSFNYFKIISSGEGGALLTNNKEVFERALIYHDSSAISFFGNQMDGFESQSFCGHEFRSNELCAAVMRVQLTRLDGILEDLRKNKQYYIDSISDVCKIVESNDAEGDCATTLAIQFDTEEEARKFATSEGIRGTLPIDTGKHVYSNWTPIMEKRGAFNPLMDPFKMEANKDIVPDYKKDMCPKTLEILSKVVYIGVDSDSTKDYLDSRIKAIREALK
ncbi:MAG: DegT/DnrJ/EryC1/StrS family aminotransferase [Clostridia bacterium]|nr:DegT/DnrJ/EryC1/StrS family aminotransferase [Clostridia bacterium]